jgi:hypothetical protein
VPRGLMIDAALPARCSQPDRQRGRSSPPKRRVLRPSGGRRSASAARGA